MNCLAVIAELKRCSVAIRYNDNVFFENQNADSSSKLAYLVDNLMKTNKIKFSKLQQIVTISGPGSFTGIRVAQSLCKGLAFALKIPATSITYFDLLSHMCEDKNNKQLIVIHSEKDQYYYKYNEEISVTPKENFANFVKDKVVIIGENTEEIQNIIPEQTLACFEYNNFRDANNLLLYADYIIDKVSPIYINAQR